MPAMDWTQSQGSHTRNKAVGFQVLRHGEKRGIQTLTAMSKAQGILTPGRVSVNDRALITWSICGECCFCDLVHPITLELCFYGVLLFSCDFNCNSACV